MALIIEDGSIVANAQSYATAEELRTFAQLRNICTVPDSDDEAEALLIKAMDYLESYRARYKGGKVSSTQLLQWPRSGVYIDGMLQSSTSIPREIYYAQLSAAIEQIDNELQENRLRSDSGRIVEAELSGMKVKYENTGKLLQVSAFAKPEALLAPLLKQNGLSLVRV